MSVHDMTAARSVVDDRGLAVDLAAAERAARHLLAALGADLGNESLAQTPRRVAETYAELLTPEPFDLTTFPNDGGYDELVVAKAIPFHSLCEHHMLPFIGVRSEEHTSELQSHSDLV